MDFTQLKIAVFGDICLDAYWHVDEAERSVETGLPVRRVRAQRLSPGGAGNVAANLAALGVRDVRVVGLVGADPFGTALRDALAERGIDTAGLLMRADWQTLVYAKPMLGDRELNRIDFGAFSTLSEEAADALLSALDQAAGACDAVILNQQMPAGTSPPPVIARINAVVAAHPQTLFVADSRHRAEQYEGVVLKCNRTEAQRLRGEQPPRAMARALYARRRKPVFITCGADGIVGADAGGVFESPGVAVTGPVDPVGAGDTVAAVLTAVLAAGGSPREAADRANRAAARTLKVVGGTGAKELRNL